MFGKSLIAIISQASPLFVNDLPYKTIFRRKIEKENREREEEIVAVAKIILDLIQWIASIQYNKELTKTGLKFENLSAQIDGVNGTLFSGTRTETQIIERPYLEFRRPPIEISQQVSFSQFIPYSQPRATTANLGNFAKYIADTINKEDEYRKLSDLVKAGLLFVIRRLARYYTPSKDLVDLVSNLIQAVKPEPEGYDPGDEEL